MLSTCMPVAELFTVLFFSLKKKKKREVLYLGRNWQSAVKNQKLWEAAEGTEELLQR